MPRGDDIAWRIAIFVRVTASLCLDALVATWKRGGSPARRAGPPQDAALLVRALGEASGVRFTAYNAAPEFLEEVP